MSDKVTPKVDIHHLIPLHDDIFVLTIRDPLPDAQIRAFRRYLYEFTSGWKDKHGHQITIMVIASPGGIEADCLTKEGRVELVRDLLNQHPEEEDGPMVEAIRRAVERL